MRCSIRCASAIPRDPKTRHLIQGVVAGISWYGNCFGCPTVGGEIAFAPEYAGNPLVNVMCVGLVRADKIFRARAEGLGNPVFYVGNKTGRDGIHGATMASAAFDERAAERRPTVQVGDPFTEKLLLEACLEAMASGAVVGIQDMGAAGLACCTSEMPARSDTGMDVDLTRVPRRESGMSAYEILLSESQERMLLVAENGREPEVGRIFAKWDLDAVEIGRVTAGPDLVVRLDGAEVARVPVEALSAAPIYEKPTAAPPWLAAQRAVDPLAFAEPADGTEALEALLGSPTIASKAWAFRQYDQQVGLNTLVAPGSDAAVLRVKGTRRGLAVATDGNARYVALDPRRGAAMAVAEAARNVSCAGGRPLGVTDCLNFGSPERPEILWQFVNAIEGIAEACRALQLPVVGGNVSFYNETSGQAIPPTPIIGVVGVLDEVERHSTQWFKGDGHRIALLGGAEHQPRGQRIPLDSTWRVGGRAGAARPRPGRACPGGGAGGRAGRARFGLSRLRRRGASGRAGGGMHFRTGAHRVHGDARRVPPSRPHPVRRGPVTARGDGRDGASPGLRGADGRVAPPVVLDRADGGGADGSGDRGANGRERGSRSAPDRVEERI